jgi:Ser/Thr protein kinase RdoA (MazF antagonist)
MDGDGPRSLLEVVGRFRLGGEVLSVAPLGSGHIHDTYVSRVRVAGDVTRFVHQRINDTIFASPDGLMRNIERVTSHLKAKILDEGGDPRRETLTVVPTTDGDNLLVTQAGEFWRTYVFIEGARTYDTIREPRHVERAGRAWAVFQRRIADLPGPPLHETIPHFGDTQRRFEAFTRAVETDRVKRVARVERELAFAEAHAGLSRVLMDLRRGGQVPERIAHYDTKLNNVMIDDRTGEGICVIDLDTVMPGTVLYDFGDFVRVGATRAAEDEQDLSRVELDLELFDRVAAGYLGAAREFLTPGEIEHLVEAAEVVAFTIGLRFLTDYLEGDSYFKVHREHHNIDRCRTQFALVADIERKVDPMRAAIGRYR